METVSEAVVVPGQVELAVGAPQVVGVIVPLHTLWYAPVPQHCVPEVMHSNSQSPLVKYGWTMMPKLMTMLLLADQARHLWESGNSVKCQISTVPFIPQHHDSSFPNTLKALHTSQSPMSDNNHRQRRTHGRCSSQKSPSLATLSKRAYTHKRG